MKKIHYSKDVDVLLIELSAGAIAYTEDDGNLILHYDQYRAQQITRLAC